MQHELGSRTRELRAHLDEAAGQVRLLRASVCLCVRVFMRSNVASRLVENNEATRKEIYIEVMLAGVDVGAFGAVNGSVARLRQSQRQRQRL